MMLTKFTHSCVRLEKGSDVLVIDPGTFSDDAELKRVLHGARTVLVTHEHPDHLNREAVLAALGEDHRLELFAPHAVAEALRTEVQADDGVRSRIVDALPETRFEVPGFEVRTFGGQHALIHPHVPMISNLGYLIDDTLYHPGDSFIVPHGLQAETLLLPIHAPWSKIGEVLDFMIAVRAHTAYPIHDGLLNATGLGIVEGHLKRIGASYGTRYEHLDAGQHVQV